MTHGTRDFRVRQQTQLSNALRAHLAEFGVVAPKGGHNVARLLALAEQTALPEAAVWPIRSLADPFRDTHTRIEAIVSNLREARDLAASAWHGPSGP